MPEEKKTEEKKTEESERTPKTTDELVNSASTFIKYLKDEGFEVEEAVCVFALAGSLMQVELLMKTILKNAKVVEMPLQPSMFVTSKN